MRSMPTVLTFLALATLVAGTAQAFTAEELAAKNIAALGGEAKLAAIQSVKMTGKLRINGGAIELGYNISMKSSSQIRIEALLQGLTQVQAYDGHVAWQINPFQGRKDPEQLPADEAKGLSEDAAELMGVLVGYKARGCTLDYLGTEDVDGTQAHKLRLTRPNGDITYVYLDPDYFLQIRTVNRRILHGVPSETVSDFDDYEKVEGVYLPFAVESGPKGSSDREKIQLEKVDVNTNAPDSLFTMPGKTGVAQ